MRRATALASVILMLTSGLVAHASKSEQNSALEFAPGEYESFRKAALPVIRDIDECEDNYKVEDATVTLINLGAESHAVALRMGGACICGATGNCPIVIFLKFHGKYQSAVREFGWDYKNQASENGSSQVSFVRNMGGGLQDIVTYHYLNGRFVKGKTRQGYVKSGKEWWEADSLATKPLNDKP